MAGDVRGDLSGCLRGGVVVGGKGGVRPLRRGPVRGVIGVSTSTRALKAFGRNDLRATFRDPLLIMIVLAPVIWTASVRIVTPLVTDMLARRYKL
ncbi:hypothetical protein MAGR_09410 [Mycolicibacterium agri]|uniref:Uncharacterized protein n=1 Tax=Mycolicibacterium agri TaxID=36811 RepID=A0A7I9VW06_MYCAG|nr:hypothetical protein MAGR_09410 [Mycolicibacterium agri]